VRASERASLSLWIHAVRRYAPRQFVALVGRRDPCKVMALLANVIKVAQFTTIAAASDWSGLYKLSLLQVSRGA